MATVISNILNKIAIGSAVLGVGTLFAGQAWCVVKPGQRALVWDRWDGTKNSPVLGEGFHFMIPFWERPLLVDIRTAPKEIDTGTGSKDLQNVSISLRVLYRPKVDKLVQIANDIGLDYSERILPSVGNEVLKAVVAQYDAGELITQREAVSQQIRTALTQRADDFHIHLDDVSITHLGFSSEYTSAIEAKQVAQQDAERARFLVLKAEQEMKAAIIRAEGESEAARLITEATSKYGSGLIELRKLEAAKEVAETLSSSRKLVFVPNSMNMIMNIPPFPNK
jgi:prohibitin 1